MDKRRVLMLKIKVINFIFWLLGWIVLEVIGCSIFGLEYI